MSNNIKDLSVAQLKEAIEIREQIETLEARLAALSGGPRLGRPPGRPAGRPPKTGARRMSAAGRAAIAAAARARWAKYRGGSATAKPAAAKKTRRMSAAARAKISAAAKARWAKAKAAGKHTL